MRVGLSVGVVLLVACGAFNGPANPPNAPWPVVCSGGGRCPAESRCVDPDLCAWNGTPVYLAKDGGAGDFPQQRSAR